MYKRFAAITAVVCASFNMAYGQHLTYGVVVGTALTKNFGSFVETSSQGSGTPTSQIIQTPAGKSLVIGPMLDWKFSRYFSVELDALHRELRFVDSFGPIRPTVTWEFPILAKYRFDSHAMSYHQFRPFIEAGPSFRTTGNLNANPTHTGLSAGGGIEVHVKNFSLAPTLRYTRWTANNNPFEIHSRPDQIELLVGFGYASDSDRIPFGPRLSVGAIMGTNILGDYTASSSTFNAIDVTNGGQVTQATFAYKSGPRSLLVEPVVEFRLNDRFSLEANAIYRPVRQIYTNIFGGVTTSGNTSFATWEMPALAKYKLPYIVPAKIIQPFVEAGPSFRLPASVSHYGFTAGVGISSRLGRATIAPAVRFTRWQWKSESGLSRNEADLLVGVTF